MRRTYSTARCPYCGLEHSMNGLATVAHMRRHVRAGSLVELTRRANEWDFVSPRAFERRFVSRTDGTLIGRMKRAGWRMVD
jgi:hypothetical protein